MSSRLSLFLIKQGRRSFRAVLLCVKSLRPCIPISLPSCKARLRSTLNKKLTTNAWLWFKAMVRNAGYKGTRLRRRVPSETTLQILRQLDAMSTEILKKAPPVKMRIPAGCHRFPGLHHHHVLQIVDFGCSGKVFDNLLVPEFLQHGPSFDSALMLQ